MINYRIIAKTGFYTSLVSYALFSMAEYVRPGFVSFVFSPHVWLVPMVAFGLWWAFIWQGESKKRAKLMVQKASLALLGVLLFIVTWKAGQGLDGGRVFVALIALIGPIAVFDLLSGEEDSENMDIYE